MGYAINKHQSKPVAQRDRGNRVSLPHTNTVANVWLSFVRYSSIQDEGVKSGFAQRTIEKQQQNIQNFFVVRRKNTFTTQKSNAND